jgi:uncharacterized pyridoxamine 5'-phosphate oxidase family protein
LKAVLDFLTTNKIFYLATTDGNQPHVRPMGFVMEYNGKLAFCTSNQKDMCKQLAANPDVEICCIDGEFNTLRLCGKVVFCTSPETQRKALEVMPGLGRMYAVGDNKFEIFYLDNPQAVCQTMSGEKKPMAV